MELLGIEPVIAEPAQRRLELCRRFVGPHAGARPGIEAAQGIQIERLRSKLRRRGQRIGAALRPRRARQQERHEYPMYEPSHLSSTLPTASGLALDFGSRFQAPKSLPSR